MSSIVLVVMPPFGTSFIAVVVVLLLLIFLLQFLFIFIELCSAHLIYAVAMSVICLFLYFMALSYILCTPSNEVFVAGKCFAKFCSSGDFLWYTANITIAMHCVCWDQYHKCGRGFAMARPWKRY